MSRTQRSRLESLLSAATLALAFAAICAVPAFAATQYLNDGAMQNTTGTWDLPAKGSCPADLSKTNRPDCVAQRLNIAQGSCVAPNYSWTTGGVCNDLVNNSAATCVGNGRVWNAATNVCGISMKGYDRNNVQCVLMGGAWQTVGTCTGVWVMPDSSTFTPPLFTGTTNPGPGDQCLRCHRSDTEWNSTRVRDVESFVATGHKNMGRKATPALPWAGPERDVHGDQMIYPTDDAGNVYDWNTGKVSVGGTSYDLAWIYADWLAPLPRSIYLGAPPVNGKPALSYSCARCHMTGWTSDATVQSSKEPEKSFPGITWDGVAAPGNRQVNLAGGVSGDTNKMASWDVWGISCTRCHGSAVENTSNGGAPPFGAAAGQATHHSNLTAPTGAVCSDPKYTVQANCQAAGATWYANSTTGTCSVAGVCSDLDPAHNTAALCPAPFNFQAATDVVRCLDIAEFGKEHDVPAYAAAKFTGTNAQRGQIITGLCMQCHRQESGGLPIETADASNLRVGANHGALAFISHPGGNQFLNSPHAKFTGAFGEVATGNFNFAGTGKYKSFFINDGEAAATGNGCTGCHDVHNSMVKGATAKLGLREECTECHTKTQSGTHHPTGLGTPFGDGSEPLVEACVTCHMPNGIHLFRINTDLAYSTFETSNPAAPNYALTAGSTGVSPNKAADGTYANAVWVDLDLACGQCHGGGTKQSKSGDDTIGAINGSLVTVGNAVDFYPGAKVRIGAAGALQMNGTREDYVSNVKSVSGNVVTLLGPPTITTVVGKRLEQNFTINGAGYKTKATLAEQAAAMHGGDVPDARFNLTTAGLKANVDASASSCQGSVDKCNVFDWNWGDNTAHGAGKITSHTYAAPGTYTITLMVEQYSAGSSTVSRTITLNGPAPTANGTCAFDANSWTATVNDASTAGGAPIRSVAIFWGDGSAISMDKTPADGFGPFNHKYLLPRALPGYEVKLKATDQRGRQTTKTLTCAPAAAPAYFAITGSVVDATSAPIALARVQLFLGTKLIRAVYSDSTGAFLLGNLKPGSYTVAVTKTGFTFPGAVAVGVGPSGPVGPIVGTPAP